jgi:hypothetical protein
VKAKELVKGLSVTAVVVTVCLGLSEIAIRIYTSYAIFYDIEMSRYATEIKRESPNPRIGHVHRPNRRATLMGVPVHINSDGFRDREYPIEHPGKYRIIFLGDSLTFGWGVEKPQTFDEILEAELNKTRPTEIINFGTGNYNTEQEVNLLLDKGLKYEPNEVVVFWFINDAEPTPRKSNWEFLGNLRIATFFWSRSRSLLTNIGRERSFREYYASLYSDQQPGWVAEQMALLELRDACSGKGIRLRVVLLPELHELEPYPFAPEHAKIMSFLRSNGIEARDLATWFAAEKEPTRLWVAPDDAHPNAIAHALIARYSLDFVAGGQDARTSTHVD